MSDPGNGDEPLRLLESVAEDGTGLKARLGRSCWDSGTMSADFGGSATAGVDIIRGAAEAGCVLGASVSDVSECFA